MLRANNLRSKSSFNLDQYSGTATLPVKTTASSKQFGSRWTLAQAESTELLTKKQEDLHNTYYNNMVMYINNKQGDNESSMSSGLKSKKELFKSRESLYSTMLPVKDTKEEEAREDCGACGQCDSCCDSCCCSFWAWVLALLFAVFGFLGGVIVGAVIQRNGVLHQMGIVLPQQPGYGQYYDYGEHFGPQFEEVDSVMNSPRQPPQPGQGQGFSGRTRIILPGEEGDPNRVIIPGQQNYNNNPYNNGNLNSNNMYQQNRGNMYQHDNSMYQNQNNLNQNWDNNPFRNNNNNNPFNTNNNNPFNTNSNNPFNVNKNNNNQMFSPKNNVRNRQAGGGQSRWNMLQSSRSLGPGLLPMGDPRCMFQFGQINTTASPGSCSLCSASRLINVTGAGYADCDGLYSISSLASIWDNKRMVYERVAGGWRPMDKRYIYWNAHFFGENFYGWSIGDKQSLSESGPFHSQGRIGAGNQPWQGSWRGNVSVELVTCNPGMAAIRDISYFGNMGGSSWESGRGRVRINPKNLEELQILRQREQETARNQQQQRLNKNNERF